MKIIKMMKSLFKRVPICQFRHIGLGTDVQIGFYPSSDQNLCHVLIFRLEGILFEGAFLFLTPLYIFEQDWKQIANAGNEKN